MSANNRERASRVTRPTERRSRRQLARRAIGNSHERQPVAAAARRLRRNGLKERRRRRETPLLSPLRFAVHPASRRPTEPADSSRESRAQLLKTRPRVSGTKLRHRIALLLLLLPPVWRNTSRLARPADQSHAPRTITPVRTCHSGAGPRGRRWPRSMRGDWALRGGSCL
jgi:hypothetical protein